LRGRSPLRPLAAATARPARVRSIMVARSSWAEAAMMVSLALPIGPGWRCWAARVDKAGLWLPTRTKFGGAVSG
jgi:hypothetical protein